jgi:hypothetical protein
MNTGDSSKIQTPRDKQSEDESGETEYAWDSSDEQEEGDTKKTAYIWDSMDEEDRADTIDNLKQSDKLVIWKSKDKWSASLKDKGFHQLLYLKKDILDDCWGSKIKGWWRMTFGQKAKKDLGVMGKKQNDSATRSTGRHDNGTPST